MAPTFDHSTKASDLVSHWRDRIAGKTILVTGVSPGGLGDHFARHVTAAEPSTLILTSRNPAKIQPVIDDIHASHPSITIKPLALDLASLANVREAAGRVNAWPDVPAIDVLVCNAGIMMTPFSLTEDGFESQFQSNHLGHFLFTNLVMAKLLAAPSPRVVSVSSNGIRFGGIRWSDPDFGGGKYYDGALAYAQAKTANCLFALGLAERLGASKGLHAYSLHPGVVSTNLFGHLGDLEGTLAQIQDADNRLGTKMSKGLPDTEVKNTDTGLSTHVFAAFSPEIETEELNGLYFLNCQLADPYEEDIPAWAASKVDADRLWKMSEKMVGQEFSY